MLVTPKFAHNDNGITAILALLSGEGASQPQQVAQGVYEINHFNGRYELDQADGWRTNFASDYPDELMNVNGDYFGSYGVCDHYQQILDQCATLTDPNREFMIFITAVCRDDQSEDGGWRWHKWGEYIGTQISMCEYLYDEPEIDQVYTYHIFERNAVAKTLERN